MSFTWTDLKGKYLKVKDVDRGDQLELSVGDLLVCYEDRGKKRIARYVPAEMEWAAIGRVTATGSRGTVTGKHKTGGSLTMTLGESLNHKGEVDLPRLEKNDHNGTWHG